MNTAQPVTRVLLVDDDRDLVDVLQLALQAHGYRVAAGYSAEDALRLVEQERPDVLVLDVMMPDATEGFHVVWQLRARVEPYFRHLPIIMLTAVHHQTPLRFYPDRRDDTYGAGEFLDVQEFIDKPVDPKDLVARIERVLRAARLISSK